MLITRTRNRETDDAQGDMRETQKDLDDLLGMSHDMFKHIVALNTYTEPFLSMRANDQRVIIEQLLGITLLSEKAEALKELIRKKLKTVSIKKAQILKPLRNLMRKFNKVLIVC
jgi:DNA repair exonuclease SbcCD ATPase subunit